MPTRVDGELFDAAKSIGAVTSRSAAQQLSHWARIGRELESSPATSMRDIQLVLAGQASYDDLDEREQAVVRATWDVRAAEMLSRLDLAAEFTAAGRSWTEADEEGRPVAQGGEGAQAQFAATVEEATVRLVAAVDSAEEAKYIGAVEEATARLLTAAASSVQARALLETVIRAGITAVTTAMTNRRP